jgi:hypothetical protein
MEEGQEGPKHLQGTGLLVHKYDEQNYLILTGAHLFNQYDDEANRLEIEDAQFFLSRVAEKTYACRMQIDTSSIQ